MAKNNKAKAPTQIQAEAMKRDGISYPFLWSVIGEYGHSFMVKNTLTGEVKMIDPSGK